MNPGNPIPNYMKCCMEQQRFLFDKEAFQRREELLAMPLKELPAQELEEYGRSALSQADRAARLDNPDWQILLKLKADGITLLLPDVQQIRGAGAGPEGALPCRDRPGPIRRRDPDRQDDVRHVAPPGRAPDVHRQPGGYRHREHRHRPPGGDAGAAGLPQPLLGADEPARSLDLAWTRAWTASGRSSWWMFRDLDDSAPMSADQLKKFIAHMDNADRRRGAVKRPRACGAWLDAQTKDEAKVAAARRRLVEMRRARGAAAAIPRRPGDPPGREARVRGTPRRRHEDPDLAVLAGRSDGRPGSQDEQAAGPVRRCPGAGRDQAVRRAQARLDQRIALLRHVEALRLYAAEHDGTLPANLSDISVPLPDDPFTGKPFRYEVDGDTAHLRGSPPAGRGERSRSSTSTTR